jgi:hypothetical protein
LDHEED